MLASIFGFNEFVSLTFYEILDWPHERPSSQQITRQHLVGHLCIYEIHNKGNERLSENHFPSKSNISC